MQKSHPTAYINKAFSERNALLSTYERELLAIMFAVKKWQHYLSVQPFVIRTDQKSLRYLLDHKMATPFQQKWLSKQAGFDFTIEYKAGTENRAADALSRIPGSQLLAMAVSSVDSSLLDELKKHWQEDKALLKIIQELQLNPTSHPHYAWSQGQLTRKGKLVVGNNEGIKATILQWMHSSTQGDTQGS